MRDGVDAEKVGRIMEWREIAADFYLFDDIIVDKSTSGEEISPLHDTVSYCLDVVETLENPVLRINKSVKDQFHPDLVVRNRQSLAERLLACRFMGYASVRKGDLLDEAFGQKFINIVPLHVKKLILDGGAAAIDY